MDSEPKKSKNEEAWDRLFEKYQIVKQIDQNGRFVISSAQINEFRESRLMAKFDHKANLPKIFRDNKLSILPISRSEYIISHFITHADVARNSQVEIKAAQLPQGIESVDYTDLFSEAAIISCAYNAGIIADILGEDTYFTISGRMSTESFSFKIDSSIHQEPLQIEVVNSQCEIDAGFESRSNLMLVEAKNYGADDLIIRQLYYPFRLWSSKVTKRVIPVFLTYTQDTFQFFIYEFRNPLSYNSLSLVDQRSYAIAPEELDMDDIASLFQEAKPIAEPSDIPFPQADKFERILDLLQLLMTKSMTKEEITSNYQFDIRQTQYYTDGARYLGFIEKGRDAETNEIIYSLTPTTRILFKQRHKTKYLGIIKRLLERKVFYRSFEITLSRGYPATIEEICAIMESSNINISGSTISRRARTVRAWIDWIWSQITSE